MEPDGDGSDSADDADDLSEPSVGYETSGASSNEAEGVGCESWGESDDSHSSDEAAEAAVADDAPTPDDEKLCFCNATLDLDESKLTTSAGRDSTCDACQRELDPSEKRFGCPFGDCDFDLCTGCAKPSRRRKLLQQLALRLNLHQRCLLCSPSRQPNPCPLRRRLHHLLLPVRPRAVWRRR
jgi:hypothetical protein